MNENERFLATDGKEICVWPWTDIRLTQTWPGGSHTCGKPVDIGVPNNGWIYAPVTCTLMYTYPYNIGYTRIYQSDEPVYTPTGLKRVCFGFTHANQVIANKTHYAQGEKIYQGGVSGNVTGPHVHMDCSFTMSTQLISYGGGCWALPDECSPADMFYIGSASVSNPMNLTFKHYDGQVSGGTTCVPVEWIIPSEQRYLTDSEMDNNAKAFYAEMAPKGWSLNSICGMLGNIQMESRINPNVWQQFAVGWYEGGFGLVQWTPATNIISFLQERGYWGNISTYGKGECERIEWEEQNGVQWIPTAQYNFSFTEFKNSTAEPGYLALAFLKNYERAGVERPEERAENARKWYDILVNWDGCISGGVKPPTSSTERKTPFWIYLKSPYKRGN